MVCEKCKEYKEEIEKDSFISFLHNHISDEHIADTIFDYCVEIVKQKERETINGSYLVSKVGFEGIEKLIYLTKDPKKAIEIREKAIKVDIEEANLRCKNTGFKRIFDDNHLANKICIEKWDGKKFGCVHKKLGIKINKEVLY